MLVLQVKRCPAGREIIPRTRLRRGGEEKAPAVLNELFATASQPFDRSVWSGGFVERLTDLRFFTSAEQLDCDILAHQDLKEESHGRHSHMLNHYRLVVSIILAMVLPSSLYAQAETLKFAWPDGASAKVQVRSEGKRVSPSKITTWDMSLNFAMHLKRINDRIVVSRKDYSGWKGKLPPGSGGGAERFVDMIPTFIVTDGGEFVGIEGHDTARKLMSDSVAQSGVLDPLQRKVFETISSNASLEAMAQSHWAFFVVLWQIVELDPEFSFEFSSVAEVPQLGGGQLDIKGTAEFVKETPCGSTRNDQRCVHLHAQSAADKTQVRKLIQSLFNRMDANSPSIADWDQQIKVDIVVEKKTMLPQHLKITRIQNMTIKGKARDETGSEEYSTTYTFNWLSAAGAVGQRPNQGLAQNL